MRASGYNIYVDLPDKRDQVLLIHGYTGAHDLVSSSVAAYVRSLEKKRPPKPLYGEWSPEGSSTLRVGTLEPATIEYLRYRGFLTDLSESEESDLVERIVTGVHKAASSRRSYVFMPTYDCNLRCHYCFQSHMRTDPRFRRLLRVMNGEMIERIFEAIEDYEGESAHGSKPSFGFFGGEPLLASSRPAVEGIMARADCLGESSFWAVTNATELEAYADLLGPNAIATIQVTLDGSPAEHDRRRIDKTGAGTWEIICRSIDLALERKVRVSARINLDRSNINDVPALAREISRNGWGKHPNFSVYAAPITANEPGQDRSQLFNSWQLQQAIEDLIAANPEVSMIESRDAAIYDRAKKIFTGRDIDPIQLAKPSFCGAHTGMFIFDAFGDVYSCWERTGEKIYRVGKVTSENRLALNSMNEKWRSRTSRTNKACAQCRYALSCGGGCAVLAETDGRGFFGNHCDEYGKRFRSAAASAFLDHMQLENVKAKAIQKS